MHSPWHIWSLFTTETESPGSQQEDAAYAAVWQSYSCTNAGEDKNRVLYYVSITKYHCFMNIVKAKIRKIIHWLALNVQPKTIPIAFQ